MVCSTEGASADKWRQLLHGRTEGGRSHKAKRKAGLGRRKTVLEGKNKNRLVQQGLTEGAANNSEEAFGDRLGRKGPHICRIGLLNPMGLTVRAGSAKDGQLLDFLKESQFDIMCLSEVNVNWSKVATRHKLDERTFGWFEQMSRKVAWNTRSDSNKKQLFGGVAMLSINDAVSKVMRGGKRDPTGLGRWIDTPYRGRNGMVMRVVCAYRPCVPSGDRSSQSVYAQHQQYFDGKRDDVCPRKAFIRDLGKEITKWLAAGDQIIICLDANEDMKQGKVAEAFQAKGLREVILEKHGMNAPPTTDNGSLTIDGIWAMQSIRIQAGGYLECGGSIPRTNHRALWIDVHYRVAYGHIIPPLVRAKARRLKLLDPRIVKRFNDKYEELIIHHQLDVRIASLTSVATYPLLPWMIKEYEWLDRMKLACVMEADKYCRKLPMGGTPFSPKLNLHHEKVNLWQLTIKKIKGNKVSSKILDRLARRTGTTQHLRRDITVAEAEEEERKAHKEHAEFTKKNVAESRETFLDDLALAIAKDGNKQKVSIVKQLKNREDSASSNRRINYACQDDTRQGITFVTVKDNAGNLVEVSSKTGIEKACIKENEGRFRQANDTPFMVSPLVENFGYLGIGENTQKVMAGTYDPPEGIHPVAVKLLEHLKMPDRV